MITKLAYNVMRNHNRDMALDELSEPQVTRRKGLGIGAGTGALLGGAATALATRGRNLGRIAAGAGAGATVGAGLGEAAHQKDKGDRDEANNYLEHYNTAQMQDILRQRKRAYQRRILDMQRQQASQEAEAKAAE